LNHGLKVAKRDKSSNQMGVFRAEKDSRRLLGLLKKDTSEKSVLSQVPPDDVSGNSFIGKTALGPPMTLRA